MTEKIKTIPLCEKIKNDLEKIGIEYLPKRPLSIDYKEIFTTPVGIIRDDHKREIIQIFIEENPKIDEKSKKLLNYFCSGPIPALILPSLLKTDFFKEKKENISITDDLSFEKNISYDQLKMLGQAVNKIYPQKLS
jgi:hypothetical protein